MLDEHLDRLIRLAQGQLRRAQETGRASALKQVLSEAEKLQSLRRRPDENREEQYFTAFRLLILMRDAGLYEPSQARPDAKNRIGRPGDSR